jgi:uncharacterized membrane protein
MVLKRPVFIIRESGFPKEASENIEVEKEEEKLHAESNDEALEFIKQIVVPKDFVVKDNVDENVKEMKKEKEGEKREEKEGEKRRNEEIGKENKGRRRRKVNKKSEKTDRADVGGRVADINKEGAAERKQVKIKKATGSEKRAMKHTEQLMKEEKKKRAEWEKMNENEKRDFLNRHSNEYRWEVFKMRAMLLIVLSFSVLSTGFFRAIFIIIMFLMLVKAYHYHYFRKVE